MASRRITIHDLTGDSSSDENSPIVSTEKSSVARQPAREPLEVLQNDARPAPKGIPAALKSAIATLSEDRVREELETLCRQHDAARQDLERKLLVTGKEVSRYHANSESEDEKEEEQSDSDGSRVFDSRLHYPKSIKSKLLIAVGDDEWTPRFAKCENCDEEFDVTENDERCCYWHTGRKEVNYGAEFWADHDENCHGTCESFEDDPEAQGGFTWSCCETTGDNEGCKITKHKAKVNVLKTPIVTPPMNTNHDPEIQWKEIAIPDIKWAPSVQRQWIQCGQCPEEYDPTDNERSECQYHPGPKVVNQEADIWHDHDEDCNGPREIFMDDSNYAEGFMYECCGGQGDDGGCEEGNHIPEDGQVPTLPTSNKRKAEDEISRPAAYARLF